MGHSIEPRPLKLLGGQAACHVRPLAMSGRLPCQGESERLPYKVACHIRLHGMSGRLPY